MRPDTIMEITRMLFITGEISHSREFSEEPYRLAGQPKELVVVPGAGHVDHMTGWNSSHDKLTFCSLKI